MTSPEPPDVQATQAALDETQARLQAILYGALPAAELTHACALALCVFPGAAKLHVHLDKFIAKGMAEVLVSHASDAEGNRLAAPDDDTPIGPLNRSAGEALDEIGFLLSRYAGSQEAIHWSWEGGDPETRIIALSTPAAAAAAAEYWPPGTAVQTAEEAFWTELRRHLPGEWSLPPLAALSFSLAARRAVENRQLQRSSDVAWDEPPF